MPNKEVINRKAEIRTILEIIKKRKKMVRTFAAQTFYTEKCNCKL